MEGEEKRMIVEKNIQSIESEAYRAIKVNLQYLFVEKKIKSIAVVSANYNEGKTTITGNLALSFSQSNKKVLVIDSNLRNPALHEMFNIENNFGLSDVLLGNVKINEVIHKYNDNVSIVTAGHEVHTPSELLDSVSMTESLEIVKNIFDLIILDTLQLKYFTDTQVLASKVDGVIVIARAEQTKGDSILEIKEKLDKSGANILGIVLNGVKTSKKKIKNR